MFVGIIVSFIGFTLSLLLHFLGVFDIYNPPRLISLLLRLGIFLVFLFWCYISKKVRGDTLLKDFNESLWNATPKWMSVVTGLTVIYSLIGFFNAFVEKHSSDSLVVTTNATETISGVFPSYWMALYAIMFMLFYSCKCLTERTNFEE